MSRGVRLSELAAEVGGSLDGDEDPLIVGAASLAEAGPGEITFCDDDRFLAALAATRAAAVIVRPGVEAPVPVLRSREPYAAFARVLGRFATARESLFPPGVHETAVIDADAELGSGVAVGPGAVIGARARIGDGCAIGAQVVVGPDAVVGRDCVLHPRCVVREGCLLGDRVILQPGAVIGSDGFGFLRGEAGATRIPQIGIVELQDDVEVGANSTVDRATTGRTVIGEGTKIDNLVQVGHNCTIGRHCAIAAQVGFAGSVTVGDGAIFGGQVGIADHVSIGEGAVLAGKTGVTKSIPAGETWIWYPAMEVRKGRRLIALLRKLPELAERLAVLESEMAAERKPEGE